MRIFEYFALDARERVYWLDEIEKGDWKAAKFLARQLRDGRVHALFGERSLLLLGIEGGALAAFCTLVERDDVDAPQLTPWIGFVYVFPRYRGKRRSGEMIERACAIARERGFERVYLSTNHVGLYEKYGFSYLLDAKDTWGDDTRVYSKTL